MSIGKRVISVVGTLLAFGMAATLSTGFIENPITAQTIPNNYRFCQLTVPSRKADVLPNGYTGPVTHYYMSDLYQGPDRSQEFQAWVRKHYQQEWVFNAYSNSYGDNVNCSTVSRPAGFGDAVKKVQSDPNLIPFYTLTNWPNVPQDPN